MKKTSKILVAAMVGICAMGGLTAGANLVFETPKPVSVAEIQTQEEQAKDLSMYIPIYALKDVNVYTDMTNTAGVVKTYKIGDVIYAYGEKFNDDNVRYFLTDDGYIRHTDCTYDEENVFYPEEKTLYAKNNAKLVDAPHDGAIAVEYLPLNYEIEVSGYNLNNYYRLKEQSWLYIHLDDTMETAYVKPAPEPDVIAILPEEDVSYTAPSGGGLTPSAGVYQGPSGKETYYNLDMSGVIAIAQGAGISGNYWVRSDGVKMYGDYVICACGFTVRPRGTIVETSLGTGICLDTGGFAENDPYQIDIAVNWP